MKRLWKDRMLLLRVLTAALGALGLAMLLSGLLRLSDGEEERRGTEIPLPEEYIEEFFPEESKSDILSEIEPEAAE